MCGIVEVVMWSWLRKIPTPTYGEFGGSYQEFTGPVDKMDGLFRDHDENLRWADCQEERDLADRELAVGLRQDLKPYHRKLYGPIYCWVAKLVFRP